MSERERERQRDRETERDRERETERERQRQRQTERQRERQRETESDKDRDRERQTDRERDRERERDRQTDRQTRQDKTEQQRRRETERREKERQDRQRHKIQRERERGGGGGGMERHRRWAYRRPHMPAPYRAANAIKLTETISNIAVSTSKTTCPSQAWCIYRVPMTAWSRWLDQIDCMKTVLPCVPSIVGKPIITDESCLVTCIGPLWTLTPAGCATRCWLLACLTSQQDN